MTDHAALRSALAEALSQVDYDAGHERSPSKWYEERADAILAHPAILAALDRSGPAEGLREVVADVAAELRWRKAATTDADLAKVLEVALAATPTASPTAGGETTDD